MTAVPPKADVHPRSCYVANANKRHRAASLDHLVGEREQLVGHLQAQRLGYAEVDDQLELGWLHHREVGRLLALEDSTGVDAHLMIGVGQIRPVACQAPGDRVFALFINRRNGVAGR
jgi:hypothetical protein